MMTLFSIFLLMAIGGVVLETILSKLYRQYFGKKYKKYHFTFSHYLYLLLMPSVGVIVTIFFGGVAILKMFLLFAIAGPIFEWLIGYGYQTIVGQKLWTYHRFSLSGYTSFLTIPFWGLGGILFYFLARIVQ